jgi:cytochrome c biogenesis protein CcmG, thiol:disulfide interchange protein DsbE
LPPTPSSTGAEPRGRPSARRIVAFGLAVVVLVGALLFVSLRSRSSTTKTPALATVPHHAVNGERAPLFTAKDLDGKTVSLASYRGRALVLAFGASWCNPCAQEYPLLVKAAAAHPHDVAMLSVMHDDLSPDARRFVRSFHASWHTVNDESNAISAAYGVVGIPQTFFITSKGVVQARVFGITSRSALDGPLNRLLQTG